MKRDPPNSFTYFRTNAISSLVRIGLQLSVGGFCLWIHSWQNDDYLQVRCTTRVRCRGPQGEPLWHGYGGRFFFFAFGNLIGNLNHWSKMCLLPTQNPWVLCRPNDFTTLMGAQKHQGFSHRLWTQKKTIKTTRLLQLSPSSALFAEFGGKKITQNFGSFGRTKTPSDFTAFAEATMAPFIHGRGG